MGHFRAKKAFTFIETIISAAVISLVILGSINLMSRIYKGILSSQFKSYSVNLASENLEFLKQQGFNSLLITPDACLPEPLTNLYNVTTPPNPYAPETVTFSARTMTLYKVVQYAVENASGDIEAKTKAEVEAGLNMDTKQVTIIVAYELDGMVKQTRLTGLVTNKEVELAGSSISGTIYKQLPSMALTAPGIGSNATVYFVGYPGYTALQSDASGHYTVSNVMPGSYIMYAYGMGFAQTYYASNPLNVSIAGSTITGIDFTCPAVQGAAVTGHVYLIGLTPVATATRTMTSTPVPAGPTNTPAILTQLLYATGAMALKTPGWNDPGYIVSQDSNGAAAPASDKFIYSEFDDFSAANSIITAVRFGARTVVISFSDKNYWLSFTKNSGVGNTWATTASPAAWTATLASTKWCDLLINANSWQVQTINIKPLYTTWLWSDINSLGMAIQSKSVTLDGYVDYARLEVDYYIPTNTPTTSAPTDTPTITPTPPPAATPTPPCADGSIVRSTDGLSNYTIQASCNYLIQDINPAGGFTSISATFLNGSTSYYKYMTGVPIALGLTTTVDIFLEESTGVPTLNGLVYDGVNRTLPIVGANVYLSDPMDISPTTTGGGAYTIMPATAGSWVLRADAPGYTLESPHTVSLSNGINTAPPLYLLPAGDISGRVTNEITGLPVASIPIVIKNSANTTIRTGIYTDTDGYYKAVSITAGSGYKVEVNPGSSFECVYPTSGAPTASFHSAVTVVQGAVTTNKNFRIKESYMHTKGFVQVDGRDVTDGILVVAYPMSVTNVAHMNRIDIGSPHLEGQTGKWKSLYSYTGSIGQRSAEYDILTPVGLTYHIYAYYSYISYTGTIQTPVKTLRKYFKEIQNIVPGSTGNNITGALSSWTAY